MPAPMGHAPYPGCETGGRPEKHTKEMIEVYADELIEWANNPDNIFTSQFALNEKKLSPPMLNLWADKNEKFADAFKYAKHQQELKIKTGALNRKFSEGFAKFLLVNNHGMQKYAEKTETTISGDAANPFSIVMNHTKELCIDDTDIG